MPGHDVEAGYRAESRPRMEGAGRGSTGSLDAPSLTRITVCRLVPSCFTLARP
jgi:hypothetical protein